MDSAVTEQNWLGNDDWGAAIVRDPLFDPNFGPWGIAPVCDCPEFARHSDDCAWTPIYAALAAELPRPNPWIDWPWPEVYVVMFPNHEPYYVQRFIFGGFPTFPPSILLQDQVFDPQWQVDEGTWTLPDFDYGQEKPDQ